MDRREASFTPSSVLPLRRFPPRTRKIPLLVDITVHYSELRCPRSLVWDQMPNFSGPPVAARSIIWDGAAVRDLVTIIMLYTL